MKKLMASAVLATAALAATPLLAHPGATGGGMGPGMMDGSQHGMQVQGQHGMRGGNGPAAMQQGMRGAQGPQAAQQLMTPEERTATMEKMRNAKTPEERQQIAAATRTEMQKRAAEKGITLPEHRGPQGRAGAGPNVTAPESNEHAH
ncbi:MAG: hypothetical protein ACREUW_13130 [Burkholderiales bacterium]